MDFDVIIIGGGPAGAGAAIQLALGGARVLLAERKRFPREKLCGEFISPECLAHFGRLGVLDGMRASGGVEVCETVFYAPSGRGVRVPSEWFAGGAGGALGLSRAEMDSRLLERARALGVSVLEDAACAGVLLEGARAVGVRLQVEGEGARQCRAPLTIDATGRARVVSRLVERERGRGRAEKHRAPLVAFKAHLEGARGAAGACEIYFYPGGYGGLSPVEGGLSNLCFIARASDVRARGSDAARVMREVLMRNSRAARTLEGAEARTRWLGVSLEDFGRHEPVPARGLLAVGDAAAFIDPFTGSGMLMALESGELAARAISEWLPRARAGRAAFDSLARSYSARYAERFDARLRVCGLLRRAAFAPTPLAELAVLMLNASERARRGLARATRRQEISTASGSLAGSTLMSDVLSRSQSSPRSKTLTFIIRAETDEDRSAVYAVNESAFGRPEEARLVDALRRNARPYVSLVAVGEGRVVGHVFFSPVSVESDGETFEAMALAPMAVLPELQNQGVGSRLVEEGLRACLRLGHPLVFVLGHPEYYPRFGFVPARPKGFTCEYPVPDEVFMVAELSPGAAGGRAGLVRYRPEFADV